MKFPRFCAVPGSTPLPQDGASARRSRPMRCVAKLEKDRAVPVDLEAADEGGRGRFELLLRRCSETRALDDGIRVHRRMAELGYDRDTFLGNLLMRMYGNCGRPAEARIVFDALRHRNVYSWNIAIVAYAQNGHMRESRELLGKMCSPDVVTWTTMVTGYGRVGDVEQSRELFESIVVKDLACWNAMIFAYTQNGHHREALKLYKLVNLEGIRPDCLTMVAVLDACSKPEEGTSVYESIRGSLLELDVVTRTAVLNMYARFSMVEAARRVFESMQEKSVVSWTSMITAHAIEGELAEAKALFDEMSSRNVVTWNAMLGGYAQAGDTGNMRCMFQLMPLRDVISWNAAVTAFAQNGDLDQAKRCFQSTPVKNVVSWNAVIAGCGQAGEGKQAFRLFLEMDLEGVQANELSFVSGLEGCSSAAALADGERLHQEALQLGMCGDLLIQNALLNMYAKCGSLKQVGALFEAMPKSDVIQWTAVIAAYAQNGEPLEALDMFKSMMVNGVDPNPITMISILTACSHAGLSRDGHCHFVNLADDYDIEPTMQHYVCMVDLLSRSGHVASSKELVHSMPFEPGDIAWMTLLGACRDHGNLKLAAQAAENVFEMVPSKSAPYVLLSHSQRIPLGLYNKHCW